MLKTEKLQLSLFSMDRLPRRPFCSNDPKQHGIYRQSPERALEHSHIQANPKAMVYRMVFDVDYAGSVYAAEDANLPAPNWIAENPKNGHVHIGYELEIPVCTSERGRSAPIRYLAAVESAYSRALKADPSYAGLICKNPTHTHWRTHVQRVEPFTLFELSEYVDTKTQPTKKQLCESPMGRNVVLFDRLRAWAYKNKRLHTSAAEFRFACVMHVLVLNDFETMLSENECKHIAKSVAAWVWKNFDVKASDQRFSKLQAGRGKLGGVAARAASIDTRAEKANARAVKAKDLRATGMTQTAIAAALGLSQPQVSALLKR